MQTLKEHYLLNVIPKLQRNFNYKNNHQIPKLKKIEINSGLGINGSNRVFLQKAIEEITTITGQYPILTKAKKSIAAFKIRQDMILGLKVTLRKEKMYSFLERLIHLVLPRIRDFRGVNPKSFDKDGNYNLGIHDQLVFPEIDFDQVDAQRGFNITIITTAKTAKESYFLLKEIGIPFSTI